MARPKQPQIQILHLDESVVVVSKPSGVLVVPDRAGSGGILRTLRQILDIGSDQDLRLVHRLDRQTSGALLVARTLDAQRALADQFQKRKVDKRYLALVAAQPAARAGIIDQRVAPARQAGKMRIDPAGKRAITKWRVLERFAGFCLLECKPVTGRTHQIRVHLPWADMPLAVDPIYGAAEALRLSEIKSGYKPSSRKPERPLIDRVTLHAKSLRFGHPTSGQEMFVEAPLPADFELALKQLRRYRKA